MVRFIQALTDASQARPSYQGDVAHADKPEPLLCQLVVGV